MHPLRSRALAARASLLLLLGLVVLATTTAAAAAGPAGTAAVTPANSSGKPAKCKDAGCVQCVKSGKSSTSCTACSTGPVDAVLDAGRCLCPAGSALTGSKNTASAAKSSSKPKPPATCSPCAVNAYAPTAQPVASAKCAVCPIGSDTRGAIGSSTCYVPGGFYYDPATGKVNVCPASKWCPGGDFANEGRVVNSCPNGSTSPQQSDEFGDCSIPAGSFYDPKTGLVSKCPQGSWCPGGSAASTGQQVNPCPALSGTAAPGASQFSQCTAPPGSYYDGNSIVPCPPNTFCPGGSVTGAGSSPFPCPPPTTYPQTGATSQSACIVAPGFFWDGSKVVQCPADKWCPGGSIGTTGVDVNKCIPGTTSAVQSDALADCQVPPGKYYDGANVVTCPANKWCPGGSVTGQGTNANNCDANTSSPAGSDAKADCVLDKGYFCVYSGADCTVTQCTADSYCPGGNSIVASAPGITPCPQAPNTVSAVGSSQLSDCKIKSSFYCAAFAGGVCTSVILCPTNKYCPGGTAVTDGVNNGLKNCPINTQSVAGSDAKADCTLSPGYYCVYDVADICTVTICPANTTCAGGDSVESPSTPGGPVPCFPGGASNPGSTVCGCNTPTNICITGSTCVSMSGNYQCVCTSTNLPVITESPGTCGVQVSGSGSSQAKTYTVAVGQSLTLTYNSALKPNRYLVLQGNQCGTVLRDTGFTGLAVAGCAASAPCCLVGAGCTGGTVCGAFPGAVPAPGGGGATGTTSPVTSGTTQVTVVSVSVCGGVPADTYQNTLNCVTPP